MQILQKHAPALKIRAGHLARELILKEGLQPEQVDIVPGAAGGPKGIGIQGLDQAIFGDFFPRALTVESWWAHPLVAGVLPVLLHMELNREPNAWVNCIPTFIFIKNDPSRGQ